MNDPRGSLWRKWDLHVHTPASLHHGYGGAEDVWEKFIVALEELPKEFSVIGINDYLFLDGYRKVLEYKSRGRLANIATFLPVLEFRIDKFAGTENKLRRINYHVIFSNEVGSDQIEQQFLNRLTAQYKLAVQHATWSGVITRQSLTDLGQMIIDTVPPDKKADYGPPIIEGFNNLNLSVKDIKQALDSYYFEGNYITAIGKTEWASLKWNDQSIAEKKTIINEADVVFISAENAASYHHAKETLTQQGVNDALLDCSDAHNWHNSGDKDSLGKCDLWIKADPTFRGLQHALLEFKERVFVGSVPPKLADLRQRPQRYIRSVSIRKTTGSSLKQVWFDSEVVFNPGLVAIIGNKGNGKSALADILALGANSLQESHYSFLNSDKFRNARDDKSIHFDAQLTWESGDVLEYKLSDSPVRDEVERVRYIPQSYLERLCNELASEGGGAFDLELRAVIFSHIPTAERLGKQSLDSLLDYLGEETYDRINNLKGELSKINRQIAALEEAASPERKREIEKKHTAKLKDLSILKGTEPKAVVKPDSDAESKAQMESLQREIEQQRAIIVRLEGSVLKAQQERKTLLAKIAKTEKVLQRVRNLEENHRILERDSTEDLATLDLKWSDLVSLSVDTTKLKELLSKLTTSDGEAKSELDVENANGLASRLNKAKLTISSLQNQLDSPTRKHQEYLTLHKEWEVAVSKLENDLEDPESITSLKAELKRISALPLEIAVLEEERIRVCRNIYDQIEGLKEHYRQLYRPVQEFIQKHQTLAESIQLSFDVHINEMNLVNQLSDWINKGRSGSFQGAEEGDSRLKDIVRRHSFDSVDGLFAFLDEFMQNLKNDMRQATPRPNTTGSQLKVNRSVEMFYDYLFGLDYLKPRYALMMEDKELYELSPGERGLLLLLFYLLVEKNDDPLILDQPEENLDNETVHQVLVPSIQLAKRRRQIIIVTHNPNLAVVSDADQIIATSIDKKDNCRVSYTTGSLENAEANAFVVRYLEGTLPAFMNRDRKYIRDAKS